MKRALRSLRAKARAARGWSMGLFIAGVAALGSGVLVAGIVAAATGSAAGLTVAAIIAGGGVATGGLSLWESRRFGRRAKQIERTISEQRLFALAQEQGGTLRVLDVARRFRIAREDAEALLDGLVDEVRVSMQVTDEGEIDYVFRELTSIAGPRVRVASSGADVVEEELGEIEAEKEHLIK